MYAPIGGYLLSAGLVGWMDGCMAGWMAGCMDGWMAGRMDAPDKLALGRLSSQS